MSHGDIGQEYTGWQDGEYEDVLPITCGREELQHLKVHPIGSRFELCSGSKCHHACYNESFHHTARQWQISIFILISIYSRKRPKIQCLEITI
jgi:hypothetical protein